MNERLNRAIEQLREQGLIAKTPSENRLLISSGDGGQEYILTHAQLLELMDDDQLTWQGIKELHRELKKRFTPPPTSSP